MSFLPAPVYQFPWRQPWRNAIHHFFRVVDVGDDSCGDRWWDWPIVHGDGGGGRLIGACRLNICQVFSRQKKKKGVASARPRKFHFKGSFGWFSPPPHNGTKNEYKSSPDSLLLIAICEPKLSATCVLSYENYIFVIFPATCQAQSDSPGALPGKPGSSAFSHCSASNRWEASRAQRVYRYGRRIGSSHIGKSKVKPNITNTLL